MCLFVWVGGWLLGGLFSLLVVWILRFVVGFRAYICWLGGLCCFGDYVADRGLVCCGLGLLAVVGVVCCGQLWLALGLLVGDCEFIWCIYFLVDVLHGLLCSAFSWFGWAQIFGLGLYCLWVWR